MFPGVFHRNVMRTILAAGIILSVSVFVLSPIIFTRLCDLFEIFTVLTGLYLIYVLITALCRKLENARPIALGAAMIILSTLNDFLHGAHIISYHIYISLGYARIRSHTGIAHVPANHQPSE